MWGWGFGLTRCISLSLSLALPSFFNNNNNNNRKGLGTCDALLCVAHTLQSALEMGQEAKIVQIDFSAAFDRVNHKGILFKLCSVWELEVQCCLF